MLSYTTLEDAYNLSLTGQKQQRKKRREESHSSPQSVPPQTIDDTVPAHVNPPINVTQAPTNLPINALGNNHMIAYIVILVVLVFAGMVYDMRASLHDIQQTLKIIASGKKL